MSLLNELKRRNVFRVGLAYVLMGWLVLQGADFALDLIGSPNWVIQSISVLVLIGLPIALFFAWAFEVTPEGIKREADVDRTQSIAPNTGRKLDRAIIAFLAIALVMVLGERFFFAGERSETQSAPEQETATVAIAKSVAVLPFADLSQAQDQEWFADGLAEEILNALAKTPDLLVSSRTSTFQYKGTDKSIPEIADELGVAHVLEGSVRSSGDRIRVTAQLIRAADNFHLWSENYDRDVNDMITIQEDLARNIAVALETTMDPAALAEMSDVGTDSIPAYQAYLEGISLESIGFSSDIGSDYLQQAYEKYEQARALDSTFAAAHVRAANYWQVELSPNRTETGTSDLTAYEMLNEYQTRINAAIDSATSEADRLRSLAGRASTALKWREAAALFEEYLQLRPNDDDARFELLDTYGILKNAEAIHAIMAYWEPMIENNAFVGTAYASAGGHYLAKEASRYVDGALRTVQRWPTNPGPLYQTHRLLLWAGKNEEASRLASRYSALVPGSSPILEAREACAAGDRQAAEATLRSLEESSSGNNLSGKWLINNMLGNTAEEIRLLKPLEASGVLFQMSGFLAYPQFDPRPYPELMAVLEREGIERGPVEYPPFQCPPPDETSIAVLPFVNMSSDPEQEFFSDGISEEILNALAQVKDLKVAGRTSSFAFKGKNDDLRTIGKALGVNHILEGSVRKAGNQVRITAQLIQVDDGFHLWSETFDRELTNIFAIQDEIAATILAELEAQLSEGQDIASTNVDLALYEKFLQARQRILERNEASLLEAARLLDEVLAEEPDYAPAAAQRGITELLLAKRIGSYGNIPLPEAAANAEPYLRHAIEVDPSLPEGHAGLGLLHLQTRQYEASNRSLLQALELNPNHVDAMNWLQQNYVDLGMTQEAHQLGQRIHLLDPLYIPAVGNLVFGLLVQGENAEAKRVVEKVKPFLSGARLNYVQSINAFISSFAGDHAEAVQIADSLPPGQRAYANVPATFALTLLEGYEKALTYTPGRATSLRPLVRLGRVEEADQLAKSLLANGIGVFDYIYVLAEQGRHEELLEVIESRWQNIDDFIETNPRDPFGAGYLGNIAHAYRVTGDSATADIVMDRFEQALTHQRNQGVNNFYYLWSWGYYYALAGDTDAAFDYFQQAVDAGYTDAARFTRFYPALQPLLGDPRMEELQQSMDRIRNSERAKLGLPPTDGSTL